MVCLCALDLSLLNRESIGRAAVSCPRWEIKVPACGNKIDADFLECQRLSASTNIRRSRGPKKIYAFPVSHYRSLSIRLDQHRRLLVNRNFTRRLRPSILHDARQKTQRPTHAIPLRSEEHTSELQS